MTSTATVSDTTGKAFWWQGSLMTIKARAADTGGALGLVEGIFYQGFGPPLHVHHREDEGMPRARRRDPLPPRGQTSSLPAPARSSGRHEKYPTPSRCNPPPPGRW